MTRILVLEDNKDSLKALQIMIEKISADIYVTPVWDLCEAEKALEAASEPFHAFLLDINLNEADTEDISGLDFAMRIRSMRQYAFTPIVMITSLANLELRAYRELHCYQYIVKPYQEEEIQKLIRKVLFQTGEASEPFVLVKKEGINYKLLCKDMIAVKAIPRGVDIVLTKETMSVHYLTIKQLLEKLPQELFLQCHRMFVVNRDHIEYVDMVNGIIHMKNGMETEIGVTYKAKVKEALHG